MNLPPTKLSSFPLVAMGFGPRLIASVSHDLIPQGFVRHHEVASRSLAWDLLNPENRHSSTFQGAAKALHIAPNSTLCLRSASRAQSPALTP